VRCGDRICRDSLGHADEQIFATEPAPLSVCQMNMWARAALRRLGLRDGRGRTAGLLVAATLVLLGAGCSGHRDDLHARDAAPSSASPGPAPMTLVVKLSMGPHPAPAALAALGRTRSCRAWNVTPGTYGLGQSVEHIALGVQEARRALALLRQDRWVVSVKLAAPSTYAEVPATGPRFPTARAEPCAVT
jgi:hypothetical protein